MIKQNQTKAGKSMFKYFICKEYTQKKHKLNLSIRAENLENCCMTTNKRLRLKALWFKTTKAILPPVAVEKGKPVSVFSS